jgi:penicillin-binding protein 1B
VPRRYDNDDAGQSKDDFADGEGGRWQRRFLIVALAALALLLGFLIPYTMYLNKQLVQRFGELRWQIPTRVYARPLVLAAGRALDVSTLSTELHAASYREDADGQVPGTYHQEGGRFTISSRGYIDVDGRVAPRRVQVALGGGQVLSLRDAGSGKALNAARLDPARIATLYGQKQEERRLVQLENVPELLVTGLQAVEDSDFKHHHGIDLSGMVRAAWVMLRTGGNTRQGASTLTQQLARSGLLGIGKEQTFRRKFNEILYALIMEAHYDKRVILETYLNQVYLGQRGSQAVHGVSSAAEFWFGTGRVADRFGQGAFLLRSAAFP